MMALGALLLFLGQGLAWLIGLLAKIPWAFRWSLLGGTALLVVIWMGLKTEGLVLITACVLMTGSLLGAGISSLSGWAILTRVKRWCAIVSLALGCLALLAGLSIYAFWRGQPAQSVVNAASQSGAPLEVIELSDPSQPGPYPVKTLTYGSGLDRFRPEFGEQAQLKTDPVDGSKLLDGSWKGYTGQLRTFVWGFGSDKLPINGRAWYPDGKGPFPLVVFVHGNHNMMEFSDTGYAYLGELLASRGFIFVSVDENFINGGTTDLFENFSDENDARGWLLLEHLRQWQSWNADPGSPFYDMVDLNNLAVGGHSRGGEAAAVAAAFNSLEHYPDNAALSFDYDFKIRAVVAIAPIDGQYVPTWRATPLHNVHYFVIHGSHDSDVTTFDGLDQYERVTFDPDEDWFKTALYVYRANHGQFNTVWGDSDIGGLTTGLLDRAALLEPEQQRQIARVYISAFLSAALQGQTGYLPLFEDARSAGPGWLPDTVYINRFDRSGGLNLAGFDEDIDLTSPTLAGGTIQAEGFDTWRERRVEGKWGGRETNAVYLGWNEDATPSYTLSYAAAVPTSGYTDLLFQLADANQDPGHAEGYSEPAGASPERQPVDLTVVLTDARGEKAALELSAYQMVQPQLPASLYKHKLFSRTAASEAVLRSYRLPLVDFVKANPSFDPSALSAVSFVCDQTKRGSLVLDGVGLR